MEKPDILSSGDPLVGDVVELLRELLHAFLMASVPAWIDLQLTLPQLRSVFIVADNKTSSVIQIAKQLRIGESTASRLIDKLMQAGLVDRCEDPTDRRRAIVQLSAMGEELIEKLLGREELLGEWLDKVSDEDLERFRQGLNAINNEIHAQATNDGHADVDENKEVSGL